ncbi:hypothetical protein ILUMI_24838 [Ignelater luminosus]|uniref:Uncharacterized protein n=1 Tax=Ignelater luminosus TaxID=2038154 RepID=A0A8K0G0L5_IGNLU|nr:hypothetical protein ILUMI_24838 [Ignelater luminosus]
MMMVFKNFVLLVTALFVTLAISEDDSKWVWKSGNRRSEDIKDSSSSANPRYQVFEGGPPPRPGGFRPPPDFDRPSRPIGIHQEPGFPDRPFPDRPLFVPNERPGGIRPPGGFPPGEPLRPHPDEGVLTGPVPSWVKEPPFKNYDRCKCAEKFNCNSPGISYGQCDVGKQYCCFHSKKRWSPRWSFT